jgi:outer membrane protein
VRDEFAEDRKSAPGLPGVDLERKDEFTASVGVKLTIPFYQGGRVSSQIREANEILAQRRIEADRTRSQVAAAVAGAWAKLAAARQNVKGFRSRVRAAQLALDGVIEEREVGQRTTLDVLNAQADVTASAIFQVQAERDLVVSGYKLLFEIGAIQPD